MIEGWHLFEEAQRSGQELIHIFVLEEMAERLSGFDQVVIVSPEILKELTSSPNPQGIIAEVKFCQQALPTSYAGKYLILEDIQDPGNLGTIIRTADAANFDGVFLSEKSADIYNQKLYAPCRAVIFTCRFGERIFIRLVRRCSSKNTSAGDNLVSGFD